jgi:hypothetical protein
MKFRFPRLGRVVDSTPKSPVYDKAPLAVPVYATPSSGTGTVAPPTLRFSAAKDTRGIAYRGPNAIPRKQKVEQRVQEMFPALFRIARPDDQSALGVRSHYRKFTRALVSPVKAVDKRSCYLWIEFEIEVAHGEFSVLLQQ